MKKIFTYILISLKDALSYRGDVFLYISSGVVFTMITLILWLNTNTGSVQFFIQYYFFLMLIGVLCSNWNSYFISRDIRLGRISPFLIKPVSYFIHQVGNNIGEKIIKVVFLIPILIILGLIFRVKFPDAHLFIWVSFALSAFLAASIGFVIDFILGISAFWLDDADAIREIYNLASLAFSGRFVPIAVLPVFYKNLSLFLPFRYAFSLPLEIITGQINNGNVLPLLGVQVGILLAVIIICRLLWEKGTVCYSASGN